MCHKSFVTQSTSIHSRVTLGDDINFCTKNLLGEKVMAKGNAKSGNKPAQTTPATPSSTPSSSQALQEAHEKIVNLEENVNTLTQEKDTLTQEKDTLTQQKSSLSGQVIMLTNEKSSLVTQIEEKEQAIEDLRSAMDKAASDAAKELDSAMKAKDEELASLLSWKSSHSLKIMGATVGSIIIVAGVAYVVKRFLLSGSAEDVEDALVAETPDGAVELELVSNY